MDVPADVPPPLPDPGPDVAAPPPPPPPPPLQVRFLGVGGFSLRRGTDHVLTAPLYSHPDLLAVTLGAIEPNTARIDALLETAFVSDARAILVGHGHYDHLMDVPYTWTKTAGAVILGNTTVKNLLAGATGGDHVVALDDPNDPRVDQRMCPMDSQCTGIPSGHPGDWVAVPGAKVRVRALCSTHPAQFLGIVHFGEGCVTAPALAPPAKASEWLEGATFAYLIDFLGSDGAPAFRVYYQDAPTTAPYGHVHADLLVEKRVDVAILNVGNFDTVADQPGEIVANLHPRYVIAAHWESFFTSPELPPTPIPFLPDPSVFDAKAAKVLPDEGDEPFLVDGETHASRYYRPVPGTDLVYAPE